MMPWEVLLTGRTTATDVADADDFARFTSVDEYADRSALLADVDRFDAVVVQTFRIDEEFLERAESLRIVAKRGVGVDNIDLEAAAERGIVVCNTPGANARAVAEHALSLLLSVRHKILLEDRATRAGEWDRDRFVTSEIGGDVLGIFALGNTGRTLAEVAAGVGMDVLGYDPYVPDDEFPAAVEPVGSTETLFERADVVSVHAPLTEETRGAISTAELERLDGGILINTSRGPIVDEDALVDALSGGVLEGAGLDVYREEPPPEDHPLFDLDNVVVTPHVAGWTHEANAEKNRQVVANLRTVYEGGIPESAIVPEAGSETDRS